MEVNDLKKSNDFQRFLEDKYCLSTISYFDNGKEIYDEFEFYKDLRSLLDIRSGEVYDYIKSYFEKHNQFPSRDLVISEFYNGYVETINNKKS